MELNEKIQLRFTLWRIQYKTASIQQKRYNIHNHWCFEMSESTIFCSGMIKKKLCMLLKRFLYSCRYQRFLLWTLFKKLEDFYLETGIILFCQGENLNYLWNLCLAKESYLIIPEDLEMIQTDLHVGQRKVW